MQHVQPAWGACAAAVWGPSACLADPLQAPQVWEPGPAGFVVRQLLQGRQDLHTYILWCSGPWPPCKKSRQAHRRPALDRSSRLWHRSTANLH